MCIWHCYVKHYRPDRLWQLFVKKPLVFESTYELWTSLVSEQQAFRVSAGECRLLNTLRRCYLSHDLLALKEF